MALCSDEEFLAFWASRGVPHDEMKGIMREMAAPDAREKLNKMLEPLGIQVKAPERVEGEDLIAGSREGE